MNHPRTIIAIPAAFAAAAIMAACGSGTPAPQKYIPLTAAAAIYMRASPAPPLAGMTAGIVTGQTGDVAWACAPRGGRGSMVGNCGYWAGSLLTATGQAVTFTCGQLLPSPDAFNAAKSVSCTSAVPEFGHPGYVPEPGDYIYVPDSLTVTRDSDVRIIRPFALPAYGPDSSVPAQCDTAGWTAVYSCEHPSGIVTPAPVPSSLFPTTFGPSGSAASS